MDLLDSIVELIGDEPVKNGGFPDSGGGFSGNPGGDTFLRTWTGSWREIWKEPV